MGDVEVRKKESISSLNSDLTNYPTLPSDSSPFMEKYEIDEDLELLGEVRIFIFIMTYKNLYNEKSLEDHIYNIIL